MDPYSPVFVPGGTNPTNMIPGNEQYEPPPPTDEEQEWLEQQMNQNQQPSDPTENASEGLPEEEAAMASIEAMPVQAPPDGGYDDVMKMIEENRRRNEAKRAAQSARNAEIVAAYEQRMRDAPPS